MNYKLLLLIPILLGCLSTQAHVGNLQPDSIPAAMKNGEGLLIFMSSEELGFTESERNELSNVLKEAKINIIETKLITTKALGFLDSDSVDFVFMVTRTNQTRTTNDGPIGLNDQGQQVDVHGKVIDENDPYLNLESFSYHANVTTVGKSSTSFKEIEWSIKSSATKSMSFCHNKFKEKLAKELKGPFAISKPKLIEDRARGFMIPYYALENTIKPNKSYFGDLTFMYSGKANAFSKDEISTIETALKERGVRICNTVSFDMFMSLTDMAASVEPREACKRTKYSISCSREKVDGEVTIAFISALIEGAETETTVCKNITELAEIVETAALGKIE
ncbi:MAG: hypothetical protein ACI9J3_004014 [Parvicellaceae bacterium]|jgi:hypothetical protein